MTMLVKYMPAGGPTTTIAIDDSKHDPFEVLEMIRQRLFPGVKLESEPKTYEPIETRHDIAPWKPKESDPKRVEQKASAPVDLFDGPAPKREPERKATAVRETSLIAYRALSFSGKLGEQQKKVIDLFLANPSTTYTRQEIVEKTGLTINAVCGRVNELLSEPLALLREIGRRECSVTKNTVNAIALTRGS